MVTKEQFRAALKDAFEAGFRAATNTSLPRSWEDSQIRKELDYHGYYERLAEAAVAPLPPSQEIP